MISVVDLHELLLLDGQEEEEVLLLENICSQQVSDYCCLKMLVYCCKITGDELLSDAFPLLPVVDDEGNTVEGLMQIESKQMAKGGEDIDIGCGNSFGGDDDNQVDDNVEMVNNIVEKFQLTETTVGSAMDFKNWLKEYMQKIRTKKREEGLPKPEIQAFMATAPNIAKYLLKNFSELQFYLGPAFDPDSMVFSIYPEGASNPNFLYIMGGLTQNKF